MLVVAAQLGKDVMFYDHPFLVGQPGQKGDRLGNLTVKTANLILSIGCSLHAQTTGCEN
jgi:acetolactate synthase I/II/III large subunit